MCDRVVGADLRQQEQQKAAAHADADVVGDDDGDEGGGKAPSAAKGGAAARARLEGDVGDSAMPRAAPQPTAAAALADGGSPLPSRDVLGPPLLPTPAPIAPAAAAGFYDDCRTRDEMVAKAVELVPQSSAFVDMRILGQLAAASSCITARPAIERVLVNRDPDSLSKKGKATLRRVFGQNYGVLLRHGVLRQVLGRWGALVSLSARYSHVCSASFIGTPGAPRHPDTSEHGSVSIIEPDARFSMSKTFREHS